jgi:hypothetical protein
MPQLLLLHLQNVYSTLLSFLRLLCDGTYVQIAVFGKGYFRSSYHAFSLLADNAVRLSLTEGISLFFTVLGVLGISIGISTAAYFSCI